MRSALLLHIFLYKNIYKIYFLLFRIPVTCRAVRHINFSQNQLLMLQLEGRILFGDLIVRATSFSSLLFSLGHLGVRRLSIAWSLGYSIYQTGAVGIWKEKRKQYDQKGHRLEFRSNVSSKTRRKV